MKKPFLSTLNIAMLGGSVFLIVHHFVGPRLPQRAESQSGRVESAAKGVRWLVETQKHTGEWPVSESSQSGAWIQTVNALATLALLNAPDPVSPPALEKAIYYLRNQTQEPEPIVVEVLKEVYRRNPDQSLLEQLQIWQARSVDTLYSYQDQNFQRDLSLSRQHTLGKRLKEILSTQSSQGYWRESGLWKKNGGKVYETAMSCLSLVPKG